MVRRKKAELDVGIGIIGFALLFLLASIIAGTDFSDLSSGSSSSSSSSSSGGYSSSSSSSSSSGGVYYGEGVQENYLFYMQGMKIAQEEKVIHPYPNVELGSIENYNIVGREDKKLLEAGPFGANQFYVDFQVQNITESKEFLIYFKKNEILGENKLKIWSNNKTLFDDYIRTEHVPIEVENFYKHNRNRIYFYMEKPSFFDFFNKNKMELSDIRIVEVQKNDGANKRDFSFPLERDNLQRMYIDFLIKCDKPNDYSHSIKITLNDFIVANENVLCDSKKTAKIRVNNVSNLILQDSNSLVLETAGHYMLSFSVNNVYYNEQDHYRFYLEDFGDFDDVKFYGDFDREYVDFKINGKVVSLGRDDVKSVKSMLKYGTNEIIILTQPVEIRELILEKDKELE